MWSGSRSHANPHRLEASLVLEEHGCCRAGSKLSSSLKDVLAAEQGNRKTLSLVGADLGVLLSSVKSWELSSHTKIACRLGTPSFHPLPSLLSFPFLLPRPFDAVYRQGHISTESVLRGGRGGHVASAMDSRYVCLQQGNVVSSDKQQFVHRVTVDSPNGRRKVWCVLCSLR